MDDDALMAEFDAAKAKRGKAREAAIAALAARGPAILPVLLQASHSDNSSRSEFALKVLSAFRPSDDRDREALVPVVNALLGSSRTAPRELAVELLPHLGARVGEVEERLSQLLGSGADADLINAATSALAELELPADRLAALLEPTLDHWSAWVRKTSAAHLQARSLPARSSPWEDAPLGEAVVRQLQRLGAVPGTFDPAAPRPLRDSWATFDSARERWSGPDPLGQCTEMPASVWFFDALRWKRGNTFGTWDRDFPDRTVDLIGASEGFDHEEEGRRRLLYPIAFCSLQNYYCFDLLQPGDDPAVWHHSHESGTHFVQFPTLSKFLGWLQTP